jgi:hypothetical protein
MEVVFRELGERLGGRPQPGLLDMLMGQSGLEMGLALYEDLQALRRMWAGERADEEMARQSVATTRTKMKRRRRRKHARTAAPMPATGSAARTTPAPAKTAATGGIGLEDIRAVKGLVDRIGADKVQEFAGILSR